MRSEKYDEASFFDEENLTLSEFERLCDLTETEIQEMVNYGILEPLGKNREEWVFSSSAVMLIRKVVRLRHDFDLDMQGMIVAFTLFERIQELEHQIKAIECRLFDE